MNKTAIDLSVGAGAISIPWWVQLTSGLALISFRLAMAYKEWKQK